MSLANKFAERMLQLKISSKFYFRICLVIILLQMAVVFTYTKYFNPDWNEVYNKFKYGMSMIIPLIKSGELNQAATTLTVNLGALCDEWLYAFWRSFVLWLILPLIWIYEMLPSENEGKEIIGGKQFINPRELNHEMFKRSFADIFWWLQLRKSLPFGEVYLPIKEEPKQTFAVGKPGVGKTNFINYILRQVIKRRQKGIIHDFKGDYVEKFYDDTKHKLFNPLDERSVHWCLFNDCFSVIDIEAYAWALIPNANSGEPYWNNAARDIFTGVLYYCYYNNKRTNKEIWRTLNLPNGYLYAILKQTKGGELGAKHLEDPDGRTAQSIMSNLMTFVKSFQFMQHMDGDFSITKWLTDPNEESLIFITNYANLENTLKPIIALFIQTVGKVLLSQTDDSNRRIFFFLDEFGQLPNMMTIKNMMTASRSKGGSIFIGVQDIGQIDQLYKKDLRMTILNSASNRLVFNCKDGDTAEFFSKDIGEIEYYETVVNNSIGGGSSDRVSIEKRKIKERLVKKEDIQSLPDLRAFVGIGHHDIVYSKWKYLKLKKNAPAFIQRADLNLESISDIQPFKGDNALVPKDQRMETVPPSIEEFSKINFDNMPSFGENDFVDITDISTEVEDDNTEDIDTQNQVDDIKKSKKALK